ncbi:MAG: acyl-CoA dehydrogenase [Gammaproteobacteria bacterium]|nr:acyl-CoA dehydrogenase [Gammaproteobacteria bacterium]MCW8923172.1 acyl-CoA dehydrogenase [Gammaproteobacteria bacterium]
MIWPISFIALVLAAAYFRTSHIIWTTGIAAFIFLFDLYGNSSAVTTTAAWVLFSAIFVPLNIYPLRRVLLSKHIYGLMAKIMPKISRTEQEALDAGDVWWEADLFSGKPDFSKIHNLPKPALNEKEQAFLDGPVDQLCSMLNDWQITHNNFDLPPDTWQFIKDNGFFAMIIPEEYGGLGFSAYAHSEVVMKIGSRSGSAAVTVMVPNSLGPGKLLMTYGTDEQKNYYLPRLARGEEIPCFALTGPSAGSDAGAMPDTGVVCYGSFDGKENVLGIRLNWEKRYITLAPVATLLGLAFKLHDPEHLLGEEEDRGITLALIKRETKGVEIGRRHFPLNQAFMNGPVRGKDVFIPIDWIIGGSDYVGKGWSMLMECLSDGRAISLPALGVAGGKMTSKFTGAYARIRKQFHTPIGYFEGIEEPLAEIGGQTYAMESARLLVLSCLDNGETPSVISGIVKQQLMQRMRTTVNHAMDIHGGHGICMGPNNYLARYYQLIPVGITVEGANILTRSLMIFGQGAMRSHPYLLKEVSAVHNSDKRQGLKDFDRALFAHAGFVMSNIVRSLWIGLTSAHLLLTPGRGITKYYYRQLVRLSSCFALMTDVCVGLLGGSLKRREKISGRFADALSNMYVLTATIKHFEDDGRPDEDIALLKWACDDALFNVQQAMKGIMVNLQIPLVGHILNMLVFPLSKPYQKPGDNLGHQVARLLLQPSATLDRLTGGIYTNKNPDDPTGRILLAQDLVLETADIERSIRVARRSNVLQSDDVGLYAEAREKNIINDEEFELLEQTRLAVQNAIKVDEFSNINWKVETP